MAIPQSRFSMRNSISVGGLGQGAHFASQIGLSAINSRLSTVNGSNGTGTASINSNLKHNHIEEEKSGEGSSINSMGFIDIDELERELEELSNYEKVQTTTTN